MADARSFVAALSRAGKTFEEIKSTTDASFGTQSLSRAQIYRIIKLVKEGKDVKNMKGKVQPKRVRTKSFVNAVAAAVNEDGRITIAELSSAFQVSMDTIHKTLHDDLGLSKKSARWVPKLLSDAQKKERVRVSQAFVADVCRHSMAFLDTIVTMDETMVSLHTPERKNQSKRWVQRGKPVKARVHASRTKVMVLAFFDAKGLIYTNIVPKGVPVNADYIVTTLGKFMKTFKKKRPQLAESEWRFHWDNAPVHMAAKVQNWLAANAVQVLQHPPYSPDLAPADFFIFPLVKEHLAGTTIAANGVKKAWEGVTSSIPKSAFANAFQRWFEMSQKCIEIGGDYVEKS